ncbi:MAG: MFS transporter, partial [Petrimonas sp.]|nr:MFS transporter [Petrimonas sp.]
QAFVIDMVEGKKDLPNAIALNSAMFNGARLIGPTVAGILIAATGEGVCFLLNAVSYVFVIISLLRMKVKRKEFNVKHSNVMQNLNEGFSYTFRSVPIRSVLLLLAVASFTAMQYVVLIPVFSKEVLHGTSRMFGFLMAASGLGALIGTFFLASKNSIEGLEKVIPRASMVFGLSLILFSLSRHAVVAFPMILIMGAGMMLQTASSNTLIQSIVDDDKRGRIMSIYMMAFMGTAPFGALLTGWLAKVLSVSYTLMICGIIMFGAAAVFLYYLPSIKKAIKNAENKNAINL